MHYGEHSADLARHLRRQKIDAERRLWYFLRNRRLSGHKFRRQTPIGPYIVDFCCYGRKLVVELDGGQHAFQCLKDGWRERHLRDRGYKVIRFWNDKVFKEIDTVLQVINDELQGPLTPRRTAGADLSQRER